MKNCKRLITLMLVVVMMFALAVGGEASETSAENTGTDLGIDTAAQTSIIIGMDSEPTSLDPMVNGGEASTAAMSSVYEKLFNYAIDGSLSPCLAKSMEWQDDNTLVIYLQEGVKYQNGNDFKGNDVLYSIKRFSENPQYANRVGDIVVEDSYCEDDYTVVLKTTRKAGTITSNLTSVFMFDEEWMLENDESIDQISNGTGPYVLTEWKMSDCFQMDKNLEYWNIENNNPYFDSIILKFFNDATTAFLEFETGTLDIVYVQNSEDINTMLAGGIEGTYLTRLPAHFISGLAMSQFVGDTFKDISIRKAIAHAIDVETMITALCGESVVVANSVIPSDDVTHIDLPYEYDPELAKEYLEEYKDAAGVDTVVLNMVVPSTGYNTDIAEAIQAYLAEIGIDMNIESGQLFDVIPRMIAGEVDFTINQAGGGADPSEIFSGMERGCGNLVAEFADDEICQLLEDAKIPTEMAERKDLYEQVQQLNHDGYWFIPLFETQKFFASVDGVTGIELDLSSRCLNLQVLAFGG